MFTSLMTLARAGEHRFEAPRGPETGHQMFGGQLLAQCLRAALATLDDDRDVHSLHAYFLRPGDIGLALDVAVDAVRDGRGFSSREVRAGQRGKEIFRMLASFQTEEEAPEYVGAPMPAAPPPEAVTFTYDDFTLQLMGGDDWYGSRRPMDIRYVNPPRERGRAVVEAQLMWMRIRDALPAEPALHRCGLVYLADSTLIDHVLLPHGLRWQDEGFVGASLDHAMWFHRRARADEWLLYEQQVEVTGGGRGLARGRMFTRDGALVASCMQEGLMRWLR